MSIGHTAKRLLGHGHGHGHDHGHGHGHDVRLHPAGDGFVAKIAKSHARLCPDPASCRGITILSY